MPVTAILLLFLAACLHTLWNVLLKQAQEKFIASWWVTLIGGLLSLPVLLYVGPPPREIWPFVGVSVIVETAYFLLLSYAYREGDFSLVYPMARGSAPAFLAVWSITLLQERPTPGGLLGLGLIVLGLVIIGLSGLLARRGERPHLKSIAAALGIAVLISIYTAVDGTAVKRTEALSYATLIFVLIPIVITPMALGRYGWARLQVEWGEHKRAFSITGLLGILAYLIALAAYTIAPLSYAGAVREMSVVIGALVGWRFLGERMGSLRVAGSVMIFAGILTIALLG